MSAWHRWAEVFIVRRQGLGGQKGSTINSTATCSTRRGMGSVSMYLALDSPYDGKFMFGEFTWYLTAIFAYSGICLLCSLHPAELIFWSHIKWLGCRWNLIPPKSSICLLSCQHVVAFISRKHIKCFKSLGWWRCLLAMESVLTKIYVRVTLCWNMIFICYGTLAHPLNFTL